MERTTKLNLFAKTQNEELFMLVLHLQTTIDANLIFLTCKGDQVRV